MIEENAMDSTVAPEQQESGSDFGGEAFVDNVPETDSTVADNATVQDESPKPSLPKKTRENRLKRENYELKYKHEQLEQEIERLKQVSENSTKAAMYNQDRSVQLELERAEERYTKAGEDGDLKEQAKAMADIGKYSAQLENLNAWKSYQQVQTETQQRPQQQEQREYEEPQVQLNEETQGWIDENPWYVPNSPQYDPDMAEEVWAYATNLERKLQRSGQSHKIATKEYYNQINDYIKTEFYNEPVSNQRTINMKQVGNHVGGVNRGGSKGAPAQRITLSADEKDMASRSGVSEESWLKNKLEDMQQQKASGRT